MTLIPDWFIPRHKALKEIIREISICYLHFPKYVIQVLQHIDVVSFGSLDQAISIRCSDSAIIRLAEEPILPTNDKWADCIFGGVVRDGNAAIF